MKLGNLNDLLLMELKDIYSAESMVLKALPKMAKAASSPQLREAFKEHQEETKKQIERLNQVFSNRGVPPKSKKCEGMEGIIAENEAFLEAQGDPAVKDAALIACAQKVEHYEICGYGTCRAFAQSLGDEPSASLLQQTLDEEKKTDKLLTRLAEKEINRGGESERMAA